MSGSCGLEQVYEYHTENTFFKINLCQQVRGDKVDTVQFNGNVWEQVYFVKPNQNAAGALAINSISLVQLNKFLHICGRD